MNTIIVVNPQGMLVGQSIGNSDSVPLFCTAAAKAVLVERLEALDGRCKRCGVVARSEELLDGKCVPTVGCGTESEVEQALLDAPREVRTLLMIEYANQAITNFIDSKGHGVADKPTDTPPTAAPDLLAGW